jgi:AraC-like DNA-binding protein
MDDLIRASALQGFAELVRELGGDPLPVLSAAHLRADLLGDTEAYVPFTAMARVVERAATELACPDFALRLATRQSIEILGPVSLIARHSATALAAVGGIAEYLHTYSPAMRISFEPVTGTTTRYLFEVVVPGLPSRAHVHELALGVTLGIFRLLMGARFRPLRVAFPHAPLSQPARYRRFFGCPVDFGTAHCGIDLATADLDQRLPADDPQVRQYIARYLAPTDSGLADDLTDRVRHLIDKTLPTGHASAVTVAAHLGLHPRTLQRRLASEGSTFERLLDDVRRDRARHYLGESDLALGQIATMLGYAQQSCLTRASTRWFGAPPRTVRNAAKTPPFVQDPAGTEGARPTIRATATA